VIFLVHAQYGIMVGEELTVNLVWGGYELSTSLIGVVKEVVAWELSHELSCVKVIYRADYVSVYYHNIIGEMIAFGVETI
jgi:hypothetical protein